MSQTARILMVDDEASIRLTLARRATSSMCAAKATCSRRSANSRKSSAGICYDDGLPKDENYILVSEADCERQFAPGMRPRSNRPLTTSCFHLGWAASSRPW
jgi:hypothetical protein